MRVVTWNCRSGFAHKRPALLALNPDVAVVPEAGRGVPGTSAWVGDLPHKGLAVVVPRGVCSAPAPVAAAARWGLTQDVTVDPVAFGVLGIWTVPATPRPSHPYIAAARALLASHAAWIRSKPTIVAGDFNVSGQSNAREMPALMAEICDRFDLKSAWHDHTGERVGAESAPTLWWRGKPEAGFHCDFVFVPRAWSVTAVRIGSYADWGAEGLAHRSDHAPVIVDLDPTFGPAG